MHLGSDWGSADLDWIAWGSSLAHTSLLQQAGPAACSWGWQRGERESKPSPSSGCVTFVTIPLTKASSHV